MSLAVKVASKTDKGLIRQGNEDHLHIDEEHHVYAVCDGMGGHQAGEVASMTASEIIGQSFSLMEKQLRAEKILSPGQHLPANSDLLLRSIRLANRAIHLKALHNSSHSGMGTTVVAISLEGDIATVAHVGDSRVYRLSESSLEPLTRDHSWLEEIQAAQNLTAEEAGAVVGKNVITRALGVRETVEVDYRIIKISPGDKFVLCSDGLCGFADDDEIFEVARKNINDIEKITSSLVQMANDRGGADNVTIITLEIMETEASDQGELEVRTLPNETEAILLAEDEFLDRLARTEVEAAIADAQAADAKGPNKGLLVGIFLAFAVLAVVVIWLQLD